MVARARDGVSVHCPNCGNCTADCNQPGHVPANRDEKFDQLRRSAFVANNAYPSITCDDLTEQERKVFDLWRVTHPMCANASLLSWIEGLRYRPNEDKDFLREVFGALGEWKEAAEVAA
jgi:hypothetical protein